MGHWKDTSSWSQSDKDRSTPTAWTWEGKTFDVVVHHLYGCGDGWYVSCCRGALDISRRPLSSSNAEDAKAEALSLVQGILVRMLREIGG